MMAYKGHAPTLCVECRSRATRRIVYQGYLSSHVLRRQPTIRIGVCAAHRGSGYFARKVVENPKARHEEYVNGRWRPVQKAGAK